ncbi:MAG: adenylate/guanylate cyclase domain-containing protein [Burkholderiaceae bacterium]
MRLPGPSWIRRALVGLMVTGAFAIVLLGAWRWPLIDGIDRQIYDMRMRWQEAPPATQVVVVDVDERSLVELGRWPWSRGRVAELADLIASRGQARVVGFDILFAEAQAEPGEDEALAAALSRTPSVLGYYLSSDRGGRVNGKLPPPVVDSRTVAELGLAITDWSGFGANLPPLQAAAKGAGFFNPIIDPDGVVRRLPLLGRFGDKVYESFALAVLREYVGAPAMALSADAIELRGQRGRARLPLSDGLSALVPYASLHTARLPAARRTAGVGSGRFMTISAADLFQDRFDWNLLVDKIVLIGASAPGLSDLRASPISETLPGVEVHAALIDAALRPPGVSESAAGPVIRQRPPEARAIAIVGLVGLGAALSIAMPATGAIGVVVLALAGLAAWVGWDAFAWWHLGWSLPSAGGVLLIVALTGLYLGLGYLFEGRARRAVADLFGEYVSPALVDKMTRDPMRFSRMTSENRELTIMFTDIRGFTRIAESMEPADLREFINDFLTAMTEVIHRHHGTVDKYIGDAVMAFWGAPMDDPAHADKAVDAAMAMQVEVERLNRVNARRGWPTLVIGIGINTGVARVGDMGSKLRRAYTVLGDAVNLAARIESLTKQFGSPIIVGETTARLSQHHRFSELAQVSIAGRNEQVRIYVPVTDGAYDVAETYDVPRPARRAGASRGHARDVIVVRPVAESPSPAARHEAARIRM